MQPNTIYQGRFKGLDERIIYTVRFEFEKDNTASGQHIISIGDPGDNIRFAGEDTVEILSQVNDTFDHIMQTSATIRLLVKDDHPEFYVSDYRKVMVTIWGKPYDSSANYDNDGHFENYGIVLFSGYVEPMSYQQGFDQEWDEVEINCIDLLSATKYRKYRSVTSETDFEAKKAYTTLRSLNDLMVEALWGSTEGRLVNQIPEGYIYDNRGFMFYDESVRSSEDSDNIIFDEVFVNDALFFGDEFKDVKTYYDVLEYIMQYLNLRMTIDDGQFFIYNFEWLKNTYGTKTPEDDDFDPDQDVNKTISFTCINDNGTIDRYCYTRSIKLSRNNSLSREEVFNCISVKADIEAMEDTIVDDPLDSEATNSDYDVELYGRELVAYGGGDSAHDRFRTQITTGNYSDEGCHTQDKYFRILKNNNWTGIKVTRSLAAGQYIDLVNYFANKSNYAAMIAFGDTKNFKDMSRYMVIKAHVPADSYDPTYDLPIGVTYNGTTNMNLNPGTGKTNYIIISGSMFCTPKNDAQLTKWQQYVIGGDKTAGLNRQQAIPYMNQHYYAIPEYYHEGDDTRRLYTFDFLNRGTTSVETSCIIPPSDNLRNLRPMEEYSRAQMLKCQLWIETAAGTKVWLSELNGKYSWISGTSTSLYYFYIPVTIKRKDNFIGTEFSIVNDNDGSYEFDDKGLLIPIPDTADLPLGKFKFNIKEFAAMTFADGTPVWREVEALFLRDLTIKVKANVKGADDFTDKSDIVYRSAINETFINNKEISFKLNSALTEDDIKQMGLEGSDKIIYSNPYLQKVSGTNITYDPLTDIYNAVTKNHRKAEEHFVDAAYREHSRPLIELQMTVQEGLDADNPTNRDKTGVTHSYVFYHPWSFWRFPEGVTSVKTKFWPFAISHNLQQCTAEIKMKECNYKQNERLTTVNMFPTSK